MNLKHKQLYDSSSSTYTYILYDNDNLEAVLIDPVYEQYDRDLTLIKQLNLKLRYVLETHIHADHITSSFKFRDDLGAKIAVNKNAESDCADIQIDDGQEFNFGAFQLKALMTPGHTDTCTTFHCENMLFTGDTLLIRGCGRTDFQQGSSKKLFNSVREKLFSFPEETIVYPGHDYKGFTSSTVGEEKLFNSRLAMDKTESEFVEIMENLNLDHPKKIKEAVPANLKCGKA
jgi:glyoxylase-like metal-dependent hydrolase (beta-lactamase superfamily II)